jgi:hypothetical protein
MQEDVIMDRTTVLAFINRYKRNNENSWNQDSEAKLHFNMTYTIYSSMLSNFCLNHADNHVDHCFASLFQIICNRENGIDVDRWDYFLRDGHQLNISISFDYRRILEFCRVIEVSKEQIICFRKKERHSIYDMFQVRVNLYHRTNSHDVVRTIEEM